jgi:hypothetical protein
MSTTAQVTIDTDTPYSTNSGLLPEKTDTKVIASALKAIGLKVPRGASKRLQALSAHFVEQNDAGEELWQCDECMGEMTYEYDGCVYCGFSPDAPEGGALVPDKDAIPTALAQYSTSDLDAQVKEIRDYQSQAFVCMFELGKLIAKNYEDEFWRLRRNADGSATYKNVRAFWLAEFGYSHTHCYSLMDLVANFDRDQVARLGTTKLGIIAKATDEEARAALLEMAEDGKSVKEIKEHLATFLEEANPPADDGEEPPPVKERPITLSVKPGTHTIECVPFKKRKSSKTSGATSLGDTPYGQFVFANNTAMELKVVTDKAGAISILATFVRL